MKFKTSLIATILQTAKRLDIEVVPETAEGPHYATWALTNTFANGGFGEIRIAEDLILERTSLEHIQDILDEEFIHCFQDDGNYPEIATELRDTRAGRRAFLASIRIYGATIDSRESHIGPEVFAGEKNWTNDVKELERQIIQLRALKRISEYSLHASFDALYKWFIADVDELRNFATVCESTSALFAQSVKDVEKTMCDRSFSLGSFCLKTV
jgi:hypothetical protein